MLTPYVHNSVFMIFLPIETVPAWGGYLHKQRKILSAISLLTQFLNPFTIFSILPSQRLYPHTRMLPHRLIFHSKILKPARGKCMQFLHIAHYNFMQICSRSRYKQSVFTVCLHHTFHTDKHPNR